MCQAKQSCFIPPHLASSHLISPHLTSPVANRSIDRSLYRSIYLLSRFLYIYLSFVPLVFWSCCSWLAASVNARQHGWDKPAYRRGSCCPMLYHGCLMLSFVFVFSPGWMLQCTTPHTYIHVPRFRSALLRQRSNQLYGQDDIASRRGSTSTRRPDDRDTIFVADNPRPVVVSTSVSAGSRQA